MRTMKQVVRQGDALALLKEMPNGSVQCCVTSPPYWGLRDYGTASQLGLEPTLNEYIQKLTAVFRDVRRVLRDDGTLWLNLGDSYVGSGKGTSAAKPKEIIGLPWRVAFALQEDGWYLRQDIIWSKPNIMPEPVRDRCTKAHEYIFLLLKTPNYHYDADAIKERSADPSASAARYASKFSGRPDEAVVCPGDKKGQGYYPDGFRVFSGLRNRRSVWTIKPKPYPEAHFATFPEALVEPCILAGCPVGGTVLDTFCGSGTTGAVCVRYGREFIGLELNPEYVKLAEKRIERERQDHGTPLLDAEGD